MSVTVDLFPAGVMSVTVDLFPGAVMSVTVDLFPGGVMSVTADLFPGGVMSVTADLFPGGVMSVTVDLFPGGVMSVAVDLFPGGVMSVTADLFPGGVMSVTVDLFPGGVMSVTSKLVLKWVCCQTPGVIGSALGLVGPMSVYCNMVRLKVLLLLLRSPAISLGFTTLGEIFAYVTVFNPTTEVVTFRLRGQVESSICNFYLNGAAGTNV